MNERGQALLIQAGLTRHKQVRYMLHNTREEGECALGVLHLGVHVTREDALRCCGTGQWAPECFGQLQEKFGLTLCEAERIIRLNDVEGLDFIEIARKLEEDGVPPRV